MRAVFRPRQLPALVPEYPALDPDRSQPALRQLQEIKQAVQRGLRAVDPGGRPRFSAFCQFPEAAK